VWRQVHDRYYPVRYRRFNALVEFVLHRLYCDGSMAGSGGSPRPGVALEVGAGTGWMLWALRERGWRAVALGVVAVLAALASWRARAGAVMEVWAVREDAAG
jgi:ubiquinone/menaquinone biosynthesis C-methylase UbiE